MFAPGSCSHDFRRVFPRHITGQEATGPELCLAVLCCGCGHSPLYFVRAGERIPMATGDWPEHLQITDYFEDENEGPSVHFVKRQPG